MKDAPDSWIPCSAEVADYMLEVVPPAMTGNDCFAVGEAARHTPEGEPVFTVFERTAGRWEARDLTLTQAEEVKAVRA